MKATIDTTKVTNRHAIEEMNDEDAYRWFSTNKPEGHVMMSKEEQEDFENWLGLKKR